MRTRTYMHKCVPTWEWIRTYTSVYLLGVNKKKQRNFCTKMRGVDQKKSFLLPRAHTKKKRYTYFLLRFLRAKGDRLNSVKKVEDKAHRFDSLISAWQKKTKWEHVFFCFRNMYRVWKMIRKKIVCLFLFATVT